ncbi:MAG TPA: ABC transporter substrate-binding protein [Methylomirabilota bacterium]|nr:ABC transporter substrate-binding protein [Methylomirabilota bacterium]
MTRRHVALAIVIAFALALSLAGPTAAAPEGQLTWAMHITIAPTWFDPAEHPGVITPMIPFYALHDALVKPMPGKAMAPSLAESWTSARDGLTHEFVLRPGVKFHNGDLVTAEDVKFSFERYRGVAARLLREKVAAVEIVDPHRVRFRLKEPWPDFLTFYATPATGAAWIVPRKYVEKVGDEGFKKAPVGAGPYRFVSFNPGVEMVLEAHEGFWRKTPAVKRLVLRMVPDESTRLAMLKRGEVDIAYAMRGPLGEEVRRTPGLRLIPTHTAGTFWLDFTAEQWDPKSPWHDQRVRLAASLAIDRKAVSDAATLGFAKVSASIVPSGYEFAWPAPPIPYDPARARKLLAEAGYLNGFDAGDYTCDSSFADLGESIVNYLKAVGIRARLRPLERAAWLTQWREKKVRNLMQGQDGGFGNAATRIERNMLSRGAYAFGSYPDIDDLALQQAREIDRKRREALLHQIQKIAYERAMFAPIWEFAQPQGVGPRVQEPGLGLIEYMPFSAPYEDLTLKGR